MDASVLTQHKIAWPLLGALAVFFSCAGAQTAEPDAKEILQKTLAAYSGARTYQSTWAYTEERGQVKQQMTMEVKAKSPARIVVRVARAPGQKPPPDTEAIPELRVVMDGKTAHYENTTEKVFFKVPIPKEWRWSPEMVFPQIPAASAVKRGDDLMVDGKRVLVLQAETVSGGTTRMEIDAETFRIRRVVSESIVAFVKTVSTIAVEKETFDADIPDSAFSYRAPKGAKEIPAPPEAAGLFGPR